jgi:hypothetical protein
MGVAEHESLKECAGPEGLVCGECPVAKFIVSDWGDKVDSGI